MTNEGYQRQRVFLSKPLVQYARWPIRRLGIPHRTRYRAKRTRWHWNLFQRQKSYEVIVNSLVGGKSFFFPLLVIPCSHHRVFIHGLTIFFLIFFLSSIHLLECCFYCYKQKLDPQNHRRGLNLRFHDFKDD